MKFYISQINDYFLLKNINYKYYNMLNIQIFFF